MKRLNKIAKRITAYDEAIEQFINECEDSRKFDKDQMWEIHEGFKNNLTMEQVKVYADPEFDIYQMDEIRWGFEQGLTMEQVKLYADPKFNDKQMGEILRSFTLDGLTIDEVKQEFGL